jgi:hypothetical protein
MKISNTIYNNLGDALAIISSLMFLAFVIFSIMYCEVCIFISMALFFGQGIYTTTNDVIKKKYLPGGIFLLIYIPSFIYLTIIIIKHFTN